MSIKISLIKLKKSLDMLAIVFKRRTINISNYRHKKGAFCLPSKFRQLMRICFSVVFSTLLLTQTLVATPISGQHLLAEIDVHVKQGDQSLVHLIESLEA